MSVLVLGGTGTVGSAVVAELLRRGVDGVAVLTRSEESAGALPAGVRGVVGDLTEPATLGGAFDGVERVFLLNPVSRTELQEGLTALEEARRAGARRVVYLSVHAAEAGPHIPHFASKLAIEAALRDSGVGHTVLRPNNFYQNDLWFRDVIVEHGVYPQPIGGRGLSRVDVGDIATAAANALLDDGHEGVYTLAGPEPLTGEETARAWADALGRDVAYAGDDLEAWERAARETLPAWMTYDFRMMYAVFQERGLVATPEQAEETRRILGREPRPFEEFVRETARAWSAGRG